MKIYARIQEKGRVIIPPKILRKLKLRKGDLVLFILSGEEILIKPAKVAVTNSLDKLGRAFHNDGVTLNKWIERGSIIRGKLVEEEFDLK